MQWSEFIPPNRKLSDNIRFKSQTMGSNTMTEQQDENGF